MARVHYSIKHPTREEFLGRYGMSGELTWHKPAFGYSYDNLAEAEALAKLHSGIVVEDLHWDMAAGRYDWRRPGTINVIPFPKER